MTSFMFWFSSPAANSLCWSLLHSLWQGAVWSLLLLLLLAVIPRSKPGIRYVISLSCLAGLALGVLVTWSILKLPAEASPANLASISQYDSDPQVSSTISPSPASPTSFSSASNGSNQRPQSNELQKNQWSNWGWNQLTSFSPWLLRIWAIGVALSLLRCIRNRAAALAWKRGETILDPAVNELLTTLRREMKIHRPVRLIASAKALGPCVLGTLSPVILIPTSLVMGMTPEQWRAVLTHELAHIRRWDDLVNFCQQVLESLLFFNPAVWWIGRQIRVEREACCDVWGARLSASPMTYAQILVEIAEKLTERRRIPAIAFADERSGSLMDRVRRLVSPNPIREGRLAWPAALALLVVVIATVILLQKGSDLAVFTAAQFLTDQERVTELAKVSEEVSPQAANDTERLVINGTLRTEDGGPLPKSIWISSQTQSGNSTNGSTEGEVKGEITNSFRVDARPGVTWLQFTGDGYATTVAGPFASGRTAEIADISVVLKRGVPVTVHMTDEAGQPVEGAKITASIQVGRNVFGIGRTAETESTGHAILNNIDLDHSYRLTVTAPGFQKLEVRETVLARDEPLELQLSRAQLARGKVLSPDGAPLSGATLKILRRRKLQYTDSTGRTEPPWATSNRQGEFVLDQLLDGTVYDFVVEHPDYA